MSANSDRLLIAMKFKITGAKIQIKNDSVYNFDVFFSSSIIIQVSHVCEIFDIKSPMARNRCNFYWRSWEASL